MLDESGAAIPTAEISLTNDTTGTVSHAASDASGQFEIAGLTAGTYTLVASKAGFVEYHQDSLQLTPGQMLNADISMSISSVAQSVVVHGGLLGGATPLPSQQGVLIPTRRFV